jgi:hypothetical protein
MKPTLVGMNNPVSSKPEHVLYPVPDGCTGNRIWRMIADVDWTVGQRDYIRAFERLNVLPGKVWNASEARRRGRELFAELCARGGGHVLVFGAQTRDAMGLPLIPICEWRQVAFGCAWTWAPHPSGRNPWYNVEDNRRIVGNFLLQMYKSAQYG